MKKILKIEEFCLLLFCVFLLAFTFYKINNTYASDGSGATAVSTSPGVTTVNSTGNTLTFTFTASETMNSGGITLTVPATWSAPQGTPGIAGYTTISSNGTVGRVLDEAESTTDWTNTTSHPTACTGGLTVDNSVFHSSTGSIKCVNSSDDNHGLWYKTISPQDWSSFSSIGFWIRTTGPINNGDLTFDVSGNTDLSSAFEDLNLGSAISADTWTYVTFNFASIPSSRTAVRSFGFKISNLSNIGNNTVYVDHIMLGSTGGTIVPTFSGQNIIIDALSLTAGQTITITYGDGGGASGAVAPSSPETSTFTVKSKTVDSGGLTDIGTSPTVNVVGSDITPPMLSPISISSNNTNSTSMAKVGNDVTLTFTADDTINTPTVTIAGHSVTPINTSGNTWSATYTMISGDTEGVVPFTIDATDLASNPTSTTSTTDASTVTFDKTAPSISNVSATPSTTTATITWTTDTSSSSKILYGTTDSYGSMTTESDTGAGVTSHTVIISGLLPCTTYHYAVYSVDTSGNATTGTDNTFTTSGCSSGSEESQPIIPPRGNGGRLIPPPATTTPTEARTVTTTLQPSIVKKVSPIFFKLRMQVGSKGEEVKRLQEFLNTHGYIVATTGAGSIGHETTSFEAATKNALMKLQQDHFSEILTPQGLKGPTGIFAKWSKDYANSVLAKEAE
ncbi:MAG: peptidoglycan-binding domain-containing protein [Patescibacteria group bacterium]